MKLLLSGGGALCGFYVECGPGHEGKGDRYIKKLLEQFPDLEVVERIIDNPFLGVELIMVRPKRGYIVIRKKE